MSKTYVKKINNIPIAASEVSPNSPLSEALNATLSKSVGPEDSYSSVLFRSAKRFCLGHASTSNGLVSAGCLLRIHVDYLERQIDGTTTSLTGMELELAVSITARTRPVLFRMDVISERNWDWTKLCPMMFYENSGTNQNIYLGFTGSTLASDTTLLSFAYSYLFIIPFGTTCEFTWDYTWDNGTTLTSGNKCVRGIQNSFQNEINYTNVSTTGSYNKTQWYNYRNGDTEVSDPNNLITAYKFGNRNETVAGVHLYAEGFAPRLFTTTATVPFIKFVCTNSASKQGFINIRCVISRETNDDYHGIVDMTIKIRQNSWHIIAYKCVRGGGGNVLNSNNYGDVVYWENSGTFYLGIKSPDTSSKVSAFVQLCDLNGTATYTFGNFSSEVSSLTAADADTRDISNPAWAKAATAVIDAGNTSKRITIDWQNEISKISPSAPSTTTRSHTKWICGMYSGTPAKMEVASAANVTVGSIGSTKNEKLQYLYNPSGIGGNSPAADCRSYWEGLSASGTSLAQLVYNNANDEYALIFNKAGNYGSIIRWGYIAPYFEILRYHNDSGWKSNEWEPIASPWVLTYDYPDTDSKSAALYSELVKARTTKVGGTTSNTVTRHPIVFLYYENRYYMLVYFGGGGGESGSSSKWIFANPGVYASNTVTQLSFSVLIPSGGTAQYSWTISSETRWKHQVGSVGTDDNTIYYT